jgi:hypothetical protein
MGEIFKMPKLCRKSINRCETLLMDLCQRSVRRLKVKFVCEAAEGHSMGKCVPVTARRLSSERGRPMHELIPSELEVSH